MKGRNEWRVLANRQENCRSTIRRDIRVVLYFISKQAVLYPLHSMDTSSDGLHRIAVYWSETKEIKETINTLILAIQFDNRTYTEEKLIPWNLRANEMGNAFGTECIDQMAAIQSKWENSSCFVPLSVLGLLCTWIGWYGAV